MPKIIFQINLKQDAENWVRNAKKKKHPFGRDMREITGGIPKDLLRKIRKSQEKQAVNLVYKYLRKNSGNFLDGLKANKKLLEFYFKYKGQGLFELLSKITDQPIYAKNFYATFTLLTSAPYDPEKNWFMVIAKNPTPKQITNICHEILHLQFIHYCYDYCLKQGLTERQFQNLKESLTFLLNEPSFRKFYLAPDWGYPNHRVLRKKLKRIWQRENNFKRFLDKAIKIIRSTKE